MAKNSEKTESAAPDEDVETQEGELGSVSEADPSKAARSETVAAPALSLEAEQRPTTHELHIDFVVNLSDMLAAMTTLPHMADAARRKTMVAADALIDRLEEDLV